MTTLLLIALLGASPCTEVSVRATVLPREAVVEGVLTCRVAADGDLYVASYQRSLHEAEDSQLNDVNRALLYPHGQRVAQESILFEGTPLHGERASLGHRKAGDLIQIEFIHMLGTRTGLKGMTEGNIRMLAGWHPLFVRETGPAVSTPIQFTIRADSGWVGMIGGKPLTRDGPRVVSGDWHGRYTPVVLAREMRVDTLEEALILEPMESRAPTSQSDTSGLLKMVRLHDQRMIDHIDDTLRLGRDYLARELPDLLRSARPLVVILPLRQRLVERFDGGFALSDRAFSLPEVESLLAYHRAVIWRYQMYHRVERHTQAFDRTAGSGLGADFAAAALRDDLVADVYGETRSVSDLLDDFIVIPEIDALLHAPKIPFPEAYFRAVHEETPAYLAPDRFESSWPAGKLLYEKLRDYPDLGTGIDVTRSYLAEREPFIRHLKASSEKLGDVLLQWVGPYPKLDYALGRVNVAGNRLTVKVELLHHGAEVRRAVNEPIVVRAETRDGDFTEATRLGPGEVEFILEEPMARLKLDPNNRLVELAHAPGYQARYNNSSKPRWLFMLNNISGLVGVTAETLALSGSFSLRRQYDQRNRYAFSFRHTPSALGGTVGFAYGFGPEVDAMGLSHYLRLNLGYHELRGEGIELEPGREGYIGAGYRHDTRLSPLYSLQGHGLQANALVGAGSRESGSQFLYWRGGVSGLYLAKLGTSHALAMRLRADYLAGDAPLQSQLRVGGLSRGARGYESSAIRGVGLKAVASLEHRHVFFTHGRHRLLGGGLMWTRFEGALFANSVYLPENDSICGRHAFHDVGYGLRFIGDVVSVSPAMAALDFGFPLSGCKASDQAMTVYLSFLQSFSLF